MAESVIMPKQGQSVETCIITQWFKQKGDTVKEGDTLFAYETDKASFEEEAKLDGILLDIFYNDGDEVPVLQNIAVIGSEGDDISQFAVDSGSKATSTNENLSNPNNEETPQSSAQKPAVTASAETSAATANSNKISPRAKKLAEGKGIDASLLSASGPNGRVIERDVLNYIGANPALTPMASAKAKEEQLQSAQGTGIGGRVTSSDLSTGKTLLGGYEVKPLSNIRKLIANAMHQSLQNSAQLTHHLGADARNILALRQKVKKALADGYPTNITLNDMVCFATIKALKLFPNVNSHFLGDSMKLFRDVHLGLAVDTDRGLMVPAVQNASDLTIQGLSKQMNLLAQSCRNGNIDPDLLNPEAASFTVSNLGNYGVEMFTPIVNLPQSAILGVNTIVPRPKDLGNGAYGFVPYLGLSLTYDHRSVDGGEATRFVKQVATEIENLDFEI